MSSEELRSPVRGEVAIVGLACTYPGARNAEQYWQNIVDKFDAITEVDPEHWDAEVFYDPDPAAEDRLYSKMGGWLPTTFAFNPLKFGIPPATVAASEPDQFLLLRCIFEALRDADYLERDFNRERVSVIVGRGNYPGPGQTWLLMRTVVESVIGIMRRMRPDLSEEKLHRLRHLLKAKIPKLTPEGAAGIIPNVTTGRAANRFDFKGQNFSVDAACASALIATEIGVRNLLTGVDDMTLVGGLHICSQVPFLAIFKATRATSLSSVVRPFDENADGTLGSEGVGVLVLKRLADAERDGDRIYSVIKGVGSASDGRAKHVLAPRVEGEMMAINRALEMAQVAPDTIGLVECHGTATVVGDETEIQALEETYGPAGVHGATCAIGSVKSMIGHAMPASGAASLIKAALALYHRVLPPTLNVKQPHPRLLDPDCRFYVNTETKPWIQRADGSPRRAGINAFGFGGINAHVVMEEYAPGIEKSQQSHLRQWPTEVVIVEGPTREALLKTLHTLREYVIRVDGVALRDVAFTLNTSLVGGSHRVAIVASSLENLAEKIERVELRLSDPSCTQMRERTGIFYFENLEVREGKVALLFPGEGAQYLNMMTDLCLHFPEVRRCFDLGDAAVKDPLRTPMSTLLYPPPAFSDVHAQAAERRLWSLEHGTESVLTANWAMLTLTRSLQIRPDMMAGHSVGDWTALSASGILDFDEMISSMDRLDQIYQKLKTEIDIPKRAMLAVGAGREQVLELAQQIHCRVEIANDNCPHQVIVVTDLEGAQAFTEGLLKSGVIAERLPYDGGYHTESFTYMNDPLLQLFRDYNVRPPQVPVYCGMTAAPWPEDPVTIREIASAAYSRPILFTQTIERMYADGARIFLEAGPRGNLTAFVDDILRGKPHLTVPLNLFRRPDLTTLNHAIGMLAATHVSMNLTALYERRKPRKLSLNWERDSVEPEDREAGVMQVSKVYRYLYPPEGDEFPLPAAVSPHLPAFNPTDVSLNGKTHALPHGTEQNGRGSALVNKTSELALPTGVASLEVPIISSAGFASTNVLEDHFRVMEEFLRTEEEIMSRVLHGAAAAPAPGPAASTAPAIAPSGPSGIVARPQQEFPTVPPASPSGREIHHTTGAPSAAPRSVAVVAPVPVVPPAPEVDLQTLLLRVVSDRTGYPPETLDLDQDLEADLGIDSIKRVEIFSALQQPGNGAWLSGDGAMETLGKLKTLRQILTMLSASSASPVQASPTNDTIRSLIRTASIVDHSPGQSITLRMVLDLKEHKYLRDHSLTFVATEHDNQGNRIFKMPLTCSVEIACEAAALLRPDYIVSSALGVEVLRALQVLDNEAAPTIEIAAALKPSGEISVVIRPEDGKPYFRAGVRLAAGYSPPPPALTMEFQNPRAAQCSGEEIYTSRHMFHGPSYQGVKAIDTIADNGILATLEILPNTGLVLSEPAPAFHIDPFLFDAAGQLVGYWPIENCKLGCNILPIKLQEVTTFAASPPAGTALQCRMVVRGLSDQILRADYDVLLPDGSVWLRVLGWQGWRLYWPPRLFDYAYGRFAQYESAGLPVQSEALAAADFDCILLPSLSGHGRDPLLDESWGSVFCSKREAVEFQALGTQRQTEWLIRRTPVKDAVRAHVKRTTGRSIFPADIELTLKDATFHIDGPALRGTPAPLISSFSHQGWSVAAAGNHPSAISAIGSKEALPAGYFTPDEEDRLTRLEDPAEWKSRAVVAKQAAGKYLRPDSLEEFWQTLVIKALNPRDGTFSIADPSSAVNAEDALKVVTTREGDFLIAVAFQF